MEDLKKAIEKLENFIDNSAMPANENDWDDFHQNVCDQISDIISEYNYYRTEMDEKNSEIESLKDKLSDIMRIADI